jgi:hypothetical protein
MARSIDNISEREPAPSSRPTTLNDDEILSLTDHRRVRHSPGQQAWPEPGGSVLAGGPPRRVRCGATPAPRAEHPLSDPFTTRACRAAVRSAEGMVAEFSARGYDASNVQPA